MLLIPPANMELLLLMVLFYSLPLFVEFLLLCAA